MRSCVAVLKTTPRTVIDDYKRSVSAGRGELANKHKQVVVSSNERIIAARDIRPVSVSISRSPKHSQAVPSPYQEIMFSEK
jgi:hypothetical protein